MIWVLLVIRLNLLLFVLNKEGNMENFIKAFQSMGIIGYIIPVVFIGYFIFFLVYRHNSKNKLQAWLNEHPDAIKIYLKSGFNVITSKTISARIIGTNAYPQIVYEGMQAVIYGLSGNLEVELTYEYTRPGVIYKNVISTWGPTKIILEIEAGKNYELLFEKKEENFKLKTIEK